MTLLSKKTSLLAIATLLLIGCARRGMVTGGAKDTLAPVLKNSFPKNLTTGFKDNTIVLEFDEYVKLKNIEKQLVVSPPLKYKLDILPLTPSKTITIKIKDTLKPNTTYNLNFGQSIEDNNEGNAYSQFKYIFSTGTTIDSLQIKATIKDALEKKNPNFVSVMLYDAETFTDSTVYKETPRYIANSLDSLKTVTIPNIKAGKYKLIALLDKNKNNLFEPKLDKIGFENQDITVPSSQEYQLNLFKEKPAFKAVNIEQVSGSRFSLGYEGDATNSTTEVFKNGNKIPIKITRVPKKDSLYVWFKANKNDSLSIVCKKNSFSKNFSLKIKDQKKDTLSLKPLKSGQLDFREKMALFSNTPLEKYDDKLFTLLRKDSTKVKFTTKYNSMEQIIEFDFEKEPSQTYVLKVNSNAVVDFFDNTNKASKHVFSTGSIANYGSLRVLLENVKHFPVIIELTDTQGNVVETEYSEKNTNINFDLIKPAKYTLRVIYDTNKNKTWDAGNFIEKRQSEEVIYFPKDIDVRANWDVEQPFDVGN